MILQQFINFLTNTFIIDTILVDLINTTTIEIQTNLLFNKITHLCIKRTFKANSATTPNLGLTGRKVGKDSLSPALNLTAITGHDVGIIGTTTTSSCRLRRNRSYRFRDRVIYQRKGSVVRIFSISSSVMVETSMEIGTRFFSSTSSRRMSTRIT